MLGAERLPHSSQVGTSNAASATQEGDNVTDVGSIHDLDEAWNLVRLVRYAVQCNVLLEHAALCSSGS